jgi:hypothetical protein
MTDLTLAIGTCDLYLKFVPNCIYLANKYLEPDIERLIIGETEHLDIKNYKFINSGKLDWGQRMINGLNSVKTKYVFFILEDYYLSQKLTKEYFDWMIKFMDRERAKKLIITSVPDWAGYKYSVNIDTIKKMHPESNWLASIQPAIWDVKHLINTISPEDSPWDFEIKGSERLRNLENDHYVIKVDEPIYFNFVRKGGVLSEGAETFLEKENLRLL